MARRKHLINVHTSTGTTAPTDASLYLGEIAVQHTQEEPAIWIKLGSAETSTEYEKFIGETEILGLISGGTDIAPLSAAVISLSAGVKTNEYVAAAALNYLNDRINEISGNTGGGADVAPLSGAVISLSAAVVTISANTGPNIQPLSSATSSHIANNNIHVSSSDKTAWTNGANSGASAYTAVTALSASTVGHVTDYDIHLPEVTTGNNGEILKVVEGEWSMVDSVEIWGGTDDPGEELGEEGDIYFKTNPTVLYETDGTTGLLGINSTATSLSDNWQLEDLDLTPYKEIRCYFKAAETGSTAFTPAVVVTVPLDSAAFGNNAYYGGAMVALPFNKNRFYMVGCAVDSTKTKFQVIHQDTIWDVSVSDANNTGRYLYKIEGYV